MPEASHPVNSSAVAIRSGLSMTSIRWNGFWVSWSGCQLAEISGRLFCARTAKKSSAGISTYVKPGAVGKVVQIHGERQSTKDILDYLWVLAGDRRLRSQGGRCHLLRFSL